MTRILAPSPSVLAEAAALLNGGELVAFPTETVYGLGADATNGVAVAKIFAAKGRPNFNPLISHGDSLEMLRGEAVFDDRALSLADKFWPGAALNDTPPCQRRKNFRFDLCGFGYGCTSVFLTIKLRSI